VVPEANPLVRIQPHGRLVEEEEPGSMGDRRGKPESLALPTGQGAYARLGPVGESEGRERGARGSVELATGKAVAPRGVPDGVEHGHPAREIEALRQMSDLAAERPSSMSRGGVMGSDADPAGDRSQRSRQRRDEGTLSGAVGSEERGHAALDPQAHPVDGQDGAVLHDDLGGHDRQHRPSQAHDLRARGSDSAWVSEEVSVSM